MAEATTTINVTPKQLGKHLRSIRRKKGLSLSEVARGAGLSRRELVAYERGKLAIPESDLWVLAGSCGVDVAELMPSTPSLELTAAATATSVGDSVSALRRGQEEAGVTAYLHTLHKLQALPAGKRIPVKDRELEQIATALGSTPRSIEQKLQEVLNVSPDEAERLRAMILQPPNTKGRPRALAAGPTAAAAAAAAAATLAIEAAPVAPVAPIAAVLTPPVEPAPAAESAPVFTEPVYTEPVQTLPVAPPAFLDQPVDAPIDDVHGHNIDVFAELARLPEPVPLGDPSAPLPDVLAPQDPFADPFAGVPAIGPPEGAVELVDTTMPTGAVGAGAWNAADAPPIDVAMRQGSATWDLGEPPLVAKTAGGSEPATWETGPWQPPAPEGTDGTTTTFWEGTDDWTPSSEPTADESPADLPSANGVTELVDPVGDTPFVDVPEGEPMVIGEDTWAGAAWDPQPWSPVEAATDSAVDINPWAADQWPNEPADLGAWDHRPDPAAVDSGFYVDWGTDDPETPPGWDSVVDESATPGTEDVDAPAAWDTWSQNATTELDTTDVETTDLETTDLETTDLETTDLEGVDSETTALFGADVVDAPPAWDTWSPASDATFDTVELVDAGTVEEAFVAPDDQPPADDDTPEDTAPEDSTAEIAEIAHISWRADDSHDEDAVDVDTITAADIVANADWIVDTSETDVDTDDAVESVDTEVPEHDAQPVDLEFVVAGPDWELGNALPLVEVRGQGGLVMRRADERWALADVTTDADFVAEVEVDFRSGPGVGVLFRASMDDEGRMSGYSFDIDPIYDGGGYLVRQWQSDRELWNPIARVDGDDPASMYGTLLVRIEVVGEHLAVQVNGAEVLTVENLKQASADRGRDGASGDRVGVQAWSSSDLVIDTVRVASR